MKSFDGNTFTYDGQGRRIGKNGVTFTYDSNGRLIASSNGLEYLYDETGAFGVTYGGNTFVYRKDAQGNIVALIDSAGNIVVKYVYDAWGNHAVLDANGNDVTDANHIGNLNPFRYRGYFYDTETELYYLQTRYYDPEIGRFITIDGIEYLDPETINGLNLYAYCGDNPVMFTDPNGTAKWWEWLLFGFAIAVIAVAAVVAIVATGGVALIASAVAIGGLAGMGGNLLEQGLTKGWNNIDVGELGIQSLAGSLYGLACATTVGAGAVIAKTAVGAITNMSMTAYKSDGNVSFGQLLWSGIQGASVSLIMQGIGHLVQGYLNPQMFKGLKTSISQNIGNFFNPSKLLNVGLFRLASSFFGSYGLSGFMESLGG